MENNEVFTKIIFTGNEEEIAEISKMINVTKRWKKGDIKVENTIIKYKTNGCELLVYEENVLHVEDMLQKLISLLQKSIKDISLLEVNKTLSIAVYSKKMMPSLSFSQESLKFLCSINASLDQDIYCL